MLAVQPPTSPGAQQSSCCLMHSPPSSRGCRCTRHPCQTAGRPRLGEAAGRCGGTVSSRGPPARVSRRLLGGSCLSSQVSEGNKGLPRKQVSPPLPSLCSPLMGAYMRRSRSFRLRFFCLSGRGQGSCSAAISPTCAAASRGGGGVNDTHSAHRPSGWWTQVHAAVGRVVATHDQHSTAGWLPLQPAPPACIPAGTAGAAPHPPSAQPPRPASHRVVAHAGDVHARPLLPVSAPHVAVERDVAVAARVGPDRLSGGHILKPVARSVVGRAGRNSGGWWIELRNRLCVECWVGEASQGRGQPRKQHLFRPLACAAAPSGPRQPTHRSATR